MSRPLPTQQRLHELFDYSVVTGDLIRNTGARRGQVAGGAGERGYVRVWVDGYQQYAHRLIWRWVTGDDPGELQVDHFNQDKNNNAWHNLRLLTASENHTNTTKRGGCASPVRGVCYDKRLNRWFGKLYKDKVQYVTAYYLTEDEAVQATNTLRHTLYPGVVPVH